MSIKDKEDYYEIETIEDALELFSNLEYNVKLKTNNTIYWSSRPHVQEIIDLMKQVDDLTSDNVDLKEQRDNLLSVINLYEKQKDILWEYIWEKDYDKVSSKLDKLQ